MAGPTLLAAKAALLLSDEQVRKRIGYAAASVFVPLVLVVAFLLSLLSGTTQHNNAAVDLVFNGGPVPTTMSAEYSAQVHAMQDCLAALDNAVAEVNSQMESGTLEPARWPPARTRTPERRYTQRKHTPWRSLWTWIPPMKISKPPDIR